MAVMNFVYISWNRVAVLEHSNFIKENYLDNLHLYASFLHLYPLKVSALGPCHILVLVLLMFNGGPTL